MTAFPSKVAPSSAKLRGGYYTPTPIAEFLARWVGGAGSRMLEPSCGDGAILETLAQVAPSATGVEFNEVEAAKARERCPSAGVETADFFEWFDHDQRGAWDGLAGNPPFIRFQHWTEPTRGLAFELMRSVGLRPTKLTNAWVPFVVASALALRDGGRLGLVVPAEVMQVSYAAELRAFLVDEFAELTVVTFKRLVFDGILQEVVLILGVRGRGPARIKVAEVEDATELPTPETLTSLPHAPALSHEREKWTKYFLDGAELSALRAVREHGLLPRLGLLADVDVGIVTGRNQFFVMRPSTGLARGVEEHLRPLVSRSAHLRGIRFGRRDLAVLEREDALCRLLAIEEAISFDDAGALRAYIEDGESAAVHEGYKCSIRRQWWVVPSVWAPDAFLLRQIHDHPRIIANVAGVTSTDTIHRVRMLNGTPPTKLAAASVNSATFAFSEIMGRSYGGGVLELEPTEAEALPIPDPRALGDRDVRAVDKLLRSGQLTDALDYVDRVLLLEHHGMDDRLVLDLRAAWERLRDRRLRRGGKAA
jgi:adenine-specific DNA methylase